MGCGSVRVLGLDGAEAVHSPILGFDLLLTLSLRRLGWFCEDEGVGQSVQKYQKGQMWT